MALATLTPLETRVRTPLKRLYQSPQSLNDIIMQISFLEFAGFTYPLHRSVNVSYMASENQVNCPELNWSKIIREKLYFQEDLKPYIVQVSKDIHVEFQELWHKPANRMTSENKDRFDFLKKIIDINAFLREHPEPRFVKAKIVEIEEIKEQDFTDYCITMYLSGMKSCSKKVFLSKDLLPEYISFEEYKKILDELKPGRWLKAKLYEYPNGTRNWEEVKSVQERNCKTGAVPVI